MRKVDAKSNAAGAQADGEPTFARPLTPDKAAEYLKISKRTVVELARREEIPARKIGGRWRFSPSELAHYMGIKA